MRTVRFSSSSSHLGSDRRRTSSLLVAIHKTDRCVLLYKVQSNLDTCVDTRKKASEHSYIRPSFDNYGRSLAGFVKDKVLGVSR